MTKRRRRFKQQFTLRDRLAAWVKKTAGQAADLPLGAERDALVAKVRQAEIANRLEDWVNSTGLQPPK
ncbi:hypothetical protein [Bradyrhizobium stylosanthis]|uniref:hypothetical protein n=1 Tax=Bradyrhizobium stylosanthis TaxID=1803665 RepID=UPI0009ECED72|nr:hypothetical protein [Bradyrhizobium stylosanthis]